MEYYSTINRKKRLIHTTTWVNLKSLMESERNREQKATCSIISFLWHSGRGETIETEIRSVIVRGLEPEVEVEAQRNFGGDGCFLYLDCGRYMIINIC